MNAITEKTNTDNKILISLDLSSVRCSQKVISFAFSPFISPLLFLDFIPYGIDRAKITNYKQFDIVR